MASVKMKIRMRTDDYDLSVWVLFRALLTGASWRRRIRVGVDRITDPFRYV